VSLFVVKGVGRNIHCYVTHIQDVARDVIVVDEANAQDSSVGVSQ
jgi:hypothetical protein